jgi:hypothetical protein
MSSDTAEEAEGGREGHVRVERGWAEEEANEREGAVGEGSGWRGVEGGGRGEDMGRGLSCRDPPVPSDKLFRVR